MGRAMIKIRYRDSNELSPGLHAAAERHGRSTTVYLLSGLTAAERRAALRRLRLSARMGYCPRLPAAQLALALLLDRIRTTIGQAGAVFRLHPAGSTVPVMVISGGAIAFLLLSTVSIRVLHRNGASTASSAAGTSPVASAAAIPITGISQGRAAGLGGPGQGSGNSQPGPGALGGSSLVRSPAQAGAGGRGQGNGSGTSGGSSGSGSSGSGSSGSGSSGSGTTGTGTTGSGTAGGTTLSGGADPTPATAASRGAVGTAPAAGVTTPPAAPAAANPAPSSGPSSSSGNSGGGVCVDVGPLGICLDV